MPRRSMPPPPSGRRRAAGRRKTKALSVPNRAKMEGGSRRRSNGIDLPKFASEVSRNFGRGADQVGREIDKVIPSRRQGSGIGGAVRSGPSSNAYLRRALGKK